MGNGGTFHGGVCEPRGLRERPQGPSEHVDLIFGNVHGVWGDVHRVGERLPGHGERRPREKRESVHSLVAGLKLVERIFGAQCLLLA